jgi:beta-galactosidase
MISKLYLFLFYFFFFTYGFSQTLLFDNDWLFQKGETQGAQVPEFNDSAWRTIDLPHDWSIEDLPNQEPGKVIGPFSKESGGPRNGMSNAHTIGGTGWYRKTFALTQEDQHKLISVYFEGVYNETDVWVNGTYVGGHKHGYTSFYFDLTRLCKPAGEENVIAVRVMNYGENSRWYSGSGIYRHVKLVITNPVHIEQWGVYISTPQVSEQQAMVCVTTALSNQSAENADLKINTCILDANDRLIAEIENSQILSSNARTSVSQNLRVDNPGLWSPQAPNLYKAKVTIKINDKVSDTKTTVFGIRTILFDVEKGFLLNGQFMELKGGCVHHDNGILGAAAIDRAEERRIELLKANGYNAIRSSHYPPSETFLEACDRIGMLVIDESFDMWQKPKNKDDYHKYFDSCWEEDFSSFILRDRNHPSIILWSIGNEIEERSDSSGLMIALNLKAIANKLDPSRMITAAVCEFWDHPGRPWDKTAAAFDLLDISGYNYMWWEYENDHRMYPQRIIMGTESVPQHAFENWQLVEKHPYVIGDFVWTAIDYLGESGIGHSVCEKAKDEQLMPWPWFNAWCGDIDLIGNKKPQSYYRDVVWRNSNIAMAVHVPMPDGCNEKVSYWGWPDELQSWTWPGEEGKILDVNVYSRSSLVRLELNGRIIGEQKVSDSTKLTAKFKIPYEPGKIKAITLVDGKETDSIVFETACAPEKIRLSADRTTIRANRNDLAFVMVEIVDADNRVVPKAEIPIDILVSGAGELAAAGNASPDKMASFKQPECTTFRGKCLVILRPKGTAGEIHLEVKSAKLKSASIVIRTK